MQQAHEAGLSAITSIILALAGVFLGAALGGLIRYLLDKATERAHFRAAVWMLSDDLGRMAAILDMSAGKPDPLGVTQSPLHADPTLTTWLESDAWNSERRTLARGLQRHQEIWDQLRWVAREAPSSAGAVAMSPSSRRPISHRA